CFLDVKHDGKLSFEEFKAYFADGVLSGEELHELFHTIDTHNTNNLDTEELCEYFSQHLGEYENVLAALEDLNISILKAMGKTKKDYQEASNLEQFVTRFLLKETLNQLQSLQNSLECAMETTEEQTRQERQGPTKPEVLSIQWPGKRSSRRVQRHNSFSPNSPQFNVYSPGLLEEDNQWMTQINRLQKLIDRLEKKVSASLSFFSLSVVNRLLLIFPYCPNIHGCPMDRVTTRISVMLPTNGWLVVI
uniref:EF-hand domain-containing protein n=1 Tax=Sus scrofa TaxID=9823 RepID=A0A8D1QFA6_PIG